MAPSSPSQLRSPSPAIPGGDAPAPELAGAELAAIFRVMADLLGDPAWPQLHPRPSTDTPRPGLKCELAPDDAHVLRATRLHLGLDVAPRPVGPEPGSTPPRCAACRTSGRSPSSTVSAPLRPPSSCHLRCSRRRPHSSRSCLGPTPASPPPYR
jgi:hypothetical protein